MFEGVVNLAQTAKSASLRGVVASSGKATAGKGTTAASSVEALTPVDAVATARSKNAARLKSIAAAQREKQ